MRTLVARTVQVALLLFPLTAGSALAQSAAATGPQPALAPPEAGSENTGTQRSLSLEEALALGERNNRDLLAARARLRGSRADVERALTALLPTVSLQGKYTFNHPEVAVDLSAILGGAA